MADLYEDQGFRLQEALLDIQRITEIEDGALRNLWITQRYFTLSKELGTIMSTKDANWSTFGCWASKTAGRSIRNEEIPRFLLDALKLEERFEAGISGFLHALGGVTSEESLSVVDVVRETLLEVSLDVASGNLKVFQELAPIFARFIDDMEFSTTYNEQEIADFESRLLPGKTEEGGQGSLRRAFRSYYIAKFTQDERQRAQWVLLGNCLVGLHEQTRLQPNIRGAINAPIDEIFKDRLGGKLPSALFSPVRLLVGEHLSELLQDVRDVWERVATRYAMNLALPKGKEISLGDDVPNPAGGVPADLQELDNPQLVEVLSQFDGNLATLIGSGANNWADLNDRMGFIVDLFRSRQQDGELFGEPFDESQLQQLHAGTFPQGVL